MNSSLQLTHGYADSFSYNQADFDKKEVYLLCLRQNGQDAELRAGPPLPWICAWLKLHGACLLMVAYWILSDDDYAGGILRQMPQRLWQEILRWAWKEAAQEIPISQAGCWKTGLFRTDSAIVEQGSWEEVSKARNLPGLKFVCHNLPEKAQNFSLFFVRHKKSKVKDDIGPSTSGEVVVLSPRRQVRYIDAFFQKKVARTLLNCTPSIALPLGLWNHEKVKKRSQSDSQNTIAEISTAVHVKKIVNECLFTVERQHSQPQSESSESKYQRGAWEAEVSITDGDG